MKDNDALSFSSSSAVDRVALGAISLIGLLLLVAYWDVFARIVPIWWSKSDYSHGFLVPVVSAAYLYVNRGILIESIFTSSTLTAVIAGSCLMVSGFALLWVGILGRALPVEGASLVVVLLGLLLMLAGWRATLRLWPACLFLLLMLPIPGGLLSSVKFQLQTVATAASVFSLQTMGLPAISRGNVIVLPSAEIGVAEACSGLRMIVAFTALVAAATMFIERARVEKLILLAAILPIAVIVNAWRVVVVSVVTHLRPSLADVVHDLAGMLMMVLALAFLWLLLKFMDALFETPDELSRPVIPSHPEST